MKRYICLNEIEMGRDQWVALGLAIMARPIRALAVTTMNADARTHWLRANGYAMALPKTHRAARAGRLVDEISMAIGLACLHQAGGGEAGERARQEARESHVMMQAMIRGL